MDKAVGQAVGQRTWPMFTPWPRFNGDLSEESGGDPVRMMELLQQAQKNPAMLEVNSRPSSDQDQGTFSETPGCSSNAAPPTGLK